MPRFLDDEQPGLLIREDRLTIDVEIAQAPKLRCLFSIHALEFR